MSWFKRVHPLWLAVPLAVVSIPLAAMYVVECKKREKERARGETKDQAR